MFCDHWQGTAMWSHTDRMLRLGIQSQQLQKKLCIHYICLFTSLAKPAVVLKAKLWSYLSTSPSEVPSTLPHQQTTYDITDQQLSYVCAIEYIWKLPCNDIGVSDTRGHAVGSPHLEGPEKVGDWICLWMWCDITAVGNDAKNTRATLVMFSTSRVHQHDCVSKVQKAILRHW